MATTTPPTRTRFAPGSSIHEAGTALRVFGVPEPRWPWPRTTRTARKQRVRRRRDHPHRSGVRGCAGRGPGRDWLGCCRFGVAPRADWSMCDRLLSYVHNQRRIPAKIYDPVRQVCHGPQRLQLRSDCATVSVTCSGCSAPSPHSFCARQIRRRQQRWWYATLVWCHQNSARWPWSSEVTPNLRRLSSSEARQGLALRIGGSRCGVEARPDRHREPSLSIGSVVLPVTTNSRARPIDGICEKIAVR